VCIHCVSSRSKDSLSVAFCYVLMCVGCFGLVVNTCQVIGWKDPSEDTLTWWGDYLYKAQVEEVFVCIFLLFGLSMFICVHPPDPTQYIFHMPMTRYSLFVLKVSLNTNETSNFGLWCCFIVCLSFVSQSYTVHFRLLWYDIARLCWNCC